MCSQVTQHTAGRAMALGSGFCSSQFWLYEMFELLFSPCLKSGWWSFLICAYKLSPRPAWCWPLTLFRSVVQPASAVPACKHNLMELFNLIEVSLHIPLPWPRGSPPSFPPEVASQHIEIHFSQRNLNFIWSHSNSKVIFSPSISCAILYIAHTHVVTVLCEELQSAGNTARKINCQISRMLMTLIFLQLNYSGGL